MEISGEEAVRGPDYPSWDGYVEGLTAAAGLAHLDSLLERIQSDGGVPVLARELFALHAAEYGQLQARLDKVETKLKAWRRTNECSRRLAQIPGVGPIGAAMLVMKTPAPQTFRSGRQFAAWLGLTPKDHSTAGKVRLGAITRAGDETLRSVLVVGATAVIQQVRRGGKASPWLLELLKRKPPKLAAVALANKTARIAWKLMISGEAYNQKTPQAAPLVSAVWISGIAGSKYPAIALSRCQGPCSNSSWCDRSIPAARHSVCAGGHKGRCAVWNLCRGNHLGQRSIASALEGRTYECKRSDQRLC